MCPNIDIYTIKCTTSVHFYQLKYNVDANNDEYDHVILGNESSDMLTSES